MQHLEDDTGNGKLSPDDQGKTILIAVRIGYPGSRVSDIFIGDKKVQVPNADLRAASSEAEKFLLENIDGG